MTMMRNIRQLRGRFDAACDPGDLPHWPLLDLPTEGFSGFRESGAESGQTGSVDYGFTPGPVNPASAWR